MSRLNPAALNRVWLHSREEDTASQLVYRPDDYAFPPSRRPRDGFRLAAGGALTALTAGADDRADESAGAWAATADGVELRLPGRVLKVVSADADRLVVEKPGT